MLPVGGRGWKAGATILADGPGDKVFDIEAIQNTCRRRCPFGNRVRQSLPRLSAPCPGALRRRNGDRWDSAIMAKSMQLRDVLDCSWKASLHAHVVGTCHNEHQIDSSILFKHTQKATPRGPKRRLHAFGGLLFQHVLSGEATQPAHGHLTAHTCLQQLGYERLAIGLKFSAIVTKTDGVAVSIANDPGQPRAILTACRPPDHNIAFLLNDLHPAVVLLAVLGPCAQHIRSGRLAFGAITGRNCSWRWATRWLP